MPSRPDLDPAEALRLAARREHELLAISELSRELTVGLDLYALADLVLLNLMGQLGASRAALWLLPEGTERRPVLLRAHGVSRRMADALGATVAPDALQALGEERRVLGAREFPERLHPATVALARREGIELLAPLSSRGETLGLVALGPGASGSSYGPVELDAFQASLGMIGVALQNATLYNRLLENNRQLRVANEELTDLDRLKSEFLRNLNHELRTPLTVIIAYLTSVEDQGGLPDTVREFTGVCIEESKKLKAMLENLLDFGSATRGSLPLDVRRGDVVVPLRAYFEERLPGVTEGLREFVFEAPDAPLEAIFDRHRVLQIVEALVDNATKFTPCGTRITLRLRLEGDMVGVEVEDDGPGIPPERMTQIFASFRQGDGSPTREVGGLGLGLAFALELAHRMKGRLTASSDLGRGSLFRLSLPRAAQV
ncbi:MAG TPA: HAMP domain-containing sensor histidine kinase [Candidatus Eisenbacteria bacterium]|nr:HAMP domain-containing sensor histidine kinase [Candidatus Eisenbacteria bacterium]